MSRLKKFGKEFKETFKSIGWGFVFLFGILKPDKEMWSLIKPFFYILLLCISIAFFGIYITKYNNMWHNVDMAYNIVKDPVKEENIYERCENNVRTPISRMYIDAMERLNKLHLIIALASFAIGASIASLPGAFRNR